MKKLEAIIRPHELDELKKEFQAEGLSGMTLTEVSGIGGKNGAHRARYRGAEYVVDSVAGIKLDLFLSDEHVAEAIRAIRSAASTGDIQISTVIEAVRIRTGERGSGVA